MRPFLIECICVAMFVVAAETHGSDILNLYTDHRAMGLDDILTVYVAENAKAGSSSSTQTNKTNSAGVENIKGSGALRLIPQFGASGETSASYDGKGGTKREGTLVATISARVVKVLDNGNLAISGQKTVEINEEKEIITISGIVRPQDIESDNTIHSYSLSDAKITYSGNGVATKGQRPGFFARMFNWIL